MECKSIPLLVCVTETEYQAIKKRFIYSGQRMIGANIVEFGEYGSRCVALCRFHEMGSKGGESISLRLPTLLDQLRPSFVVELGICFGLKSEIKIGDVGVCQYAHDYEYQKVNPSGTQFRGKTVKANPELYAKVMGFASTIMGGYSVKSAQYACGEKVVNNSDLKTKILEAVPEASFGDMESFAFGLVCESRKIPWILIKASSDDGVNKGDEYQIEAASNSANFFEQFLQNAQHLEEYFGGEGDSASESFLDFDYLSQVIFGSRPSRTEVIETARNSAYIHYHPELDGAWVVIYVAKAHSIPEILKGALRRLNVTPAKLDVCISTGSEISSANIKIYEGILDDAGVRKHLISNIGGFVFETVVKRKISTATVPQLVNYVDQIIFKADSPLGQGKKFARTFLKSDEDGIKKAKPIVVILGQGGVGKTTFCRNLVRFINESSDFYKRVLLVTKADVFKSYSGEPISSIEDLYREYARGLDDRSQSISPRDFSVAMSCGSIVLMIDGVDEIESALGDKFNLVGFVESVSNLNKSLGSCRVLLTSRDVHRTRMESLKNADVVQLKGFSDEEVGAFLSKEVEPIKTSVMTLARRIRDSNNFVNPYLLHVVRQFVFDENGKGSSSVIDTRRLRLADPFDYILARLLQREIDKQSLSIKIDEYYELLIEVLVSGGNEMPVADFEAYIQTLLPSRFNTSFTYYRDPYLKFFLLEQNGPKISLSHLEYVSHILLNRLCELFSSVELSSDKLCVDLEYIFGESKYDGFALRDLLRVRLTRLDVTRDIVERAIKSAISSISAKDRSARRERVLYELYLFAFEYHGCRTASERRELLVSFHESNRIFNLSIVGEFPKVDFSGLTVENSIFKNFGEFFLCVFDGKTVFRGCKFSNCSRKFNRVNARMEMFQDCDLDEGMKSLLSAGADKRKETLTRLKSDIKQVFRALHESVGFGSLSLNRIKARSNIVSELSYDQFLHALVAGGALTFDGELYRVPKSAEMDAWALFEEDHVQGVVLNVINDLDRASASF